MLSAGAGPEAATWSRARGLSAVCWGWAGARAAVPPHVTVQGCSQTGRAGRAQAAACSGRCQDHPGGWLGLAQPVQPGETATSWGFAERLSQLRASSSDGRGCGDPGSTWEGAGDRRLGAPAMLCPVTATRLSDPSAWGVMSVGQACAARPGHSGPRSCGSCSRKLWLCPDALLCLPQDSSSRGGSSGRERLLVEPPLPQEKAGGPAIPSHLLSAPYPFGISPGSVVQDSRFPPLK